MFYIYQIHDGCKNAPYNSFNENSQDTHEKGKPKYGSTQPPLPKIIEHTHDFWLAFVKTNR